MGKTKSGVGSIGRRKPQLQQYSLSQTVESAIPGGKINPAVPKEVLSPSTEDRDRGTKFFDYRQIPTLQEYLLITQDRPCVEQYLPG